tara:strand:+ start:62 stop:757 length:696 start_codon:yes stop_codon:yes gene_type:complete
MAGNLKYTEREILNKALNSGEDALKVDIDNVQLITEGSDVNIEVHLDKAEDSVLSYANTSKDGSGTSYVPLVDSDGHLQVDVMSSGLPSGGATAANQSTIIGHVDGLEGLITSSNTKLDTLETTLTAIETDAAAIEVATEATQAAVEKNLYGTGLPITALDGGGGGAGDQDLSGTYQALYVGVGGDVVVTLATSASDFTFKNLASGQLLPVQFTHVKQSGTTATNMIALKG